MEKTSYEEKYISILVCLDCKQQSPAELKGCELGNDYVTDDQELTSDREYYYCEHCQSENVTWIKVLNDQATYKVNQIRNEELARYIKCEHCNNKIKPKYWIIDNKQKQNAI